MAKVNLSGSFSFDDALIAHHQICSIRRIADATVNIETGSIHFGPISELDLYVENVFESHKSFREGIRLCQQIDRQIENLPPADWFTKINLQPINYLQQQSDFLTFIAYSLFDRALILINNVFQFALLPKECSGKTIKKKLRTIANTNFILEKLQELDDATSPLYSARNAFAHQGQERHVARFSEWKDLVGIADACNMLQGPESIDLRKLQDILICALTDDYFEATLKAGMLLPGLFPVFLASIEEFGGNEEVTAAEVERAARVKALCRSEFARSGLFISNN